MSKEKDFEPKDRTILKNLLPSTKNVVSPAIHFKRSLQQLKFLFTNFTHCQESIL